MTRGNDRNLLPIDFRDGVLAADFAGGERDLVAGVHAVQQTRRGLELLFSCAAAARADRVLLCLPNRDCPVEFDRSW